MIKIKMIRCNKAEDFENEINRFIENKKIIDIKYQSYPVMTGTNGNYTNTCYDSAMIIYEE